MNPRIKKLAYAAKLDEHMLWTSDEGNVLPNEMIKFAELIVCECASIAAKNQAEDMSWNISEIIKEHFGVEP